mgnify:CR=1 FL=1
MARKQSKQTVTIRITTERAARLCRLVQLLGPGNSRAQILQRLDIDVRAFYRDLELLRNVGVGVTLEEGRYGLSEAPDEAMKRLPCPDPGLTLGEAQQLSKGRTKAHRKLKAQIDEMIPD